MTWLLEGPVWVLVGFGAVALAIAIGGWMQTGHRGTVYAMPVIVLLTIAAVLTEHYVVTPREEVRATLFEIAELVESNQIDAALQYLHPRATHGRELAAGELPRYEFRQVSIKSNLKIEVEEEHNPPRATARFNVVVVVAEDRLGGEFTYPRFVIVEFVKENDRWMVLEYEHFDPLRGHQRRTL